MTKKSLFRVVAASAMVVGGQFVYFPVFAEGAVDISIVELVDDGAGGYKSWEDITGAMPGETYSAIPRIKNDGTVPVTVRMCLSESATDAEGGTIMLPANTFGISINGQWVLDNEGVTDTTDPASGNCYKYNTELGVGVMTEPIFNEVTLSSALGNQYENATFNLHLDAYASGEEQPDKPDTGTITNAEPFSKTNIILYTLGGVALIVLAIHFIKSLYHKK